jgi:putative membrane protein
MRYAAIAGALALAGITAACGQPKTPAEAPPTEASTIAPEAPAADANTDYVNKLAQGDMLEIEASKIALTKTKNAEVKKYAQMMIDDHTKTTAEVGQAAAALGIVPPTIPDDATTVLIDNIKTAEADKGFDDKYLDTIIDAHESAIAAVKDYADNGADPTFKAWSAVTLPKLQAHLDKGNALREAINKAK